MRTEIEIDVTPNPCTVFWICGLKDILTKRRHQEENQDFDNVDEESEAMRQMRQNRRVNDDQFIDDDEELQQQSDKQDDDVVSYRTAHAMIITSHLQDCDTLTADQFFAAEDKEASETNEEEVWEKAHHVRKHAIITYHRRMYANEFLRRRHNQPFKTAKVGRSHSDHTACIVRLAACLPSAKAHEPGNVGRSFDIYSLFMVLYLLSDWLD